jgi:tetratricopeptide (TPR) repeat protein
VANSRRLGATARSLRLSALALALTAEGGPAVSDQNDGRLDQLFARLATAATAAEAAGVEHEIWTVWLEARDEAVDASMTRGIEAMNTGNLEAGLVVFDAIAQAAPAFAEGFNKRATIHYLMGSFEASLRDIDRTLALEPRHFGALSGLAMIREAQGRPFEALEALETLTRLHPRLPGLQERVDRLTRQLGEPI